MGGAPKVKGLLKPYLTPGAGRKKSGDREIFPADIQS
jgi:hypothetical protein